MTKIKKTESIPVKRGCPTYSDFNQTALYRKVSNRVRIHILRMSPLV